MQVMCSIFTEQILDCALYGSHSNNSSQILSENYMGTRATTRVTVSEGLEGQCQSNDVLTDATCTTFIELVTSIHSDSLERYIISHLFLRGEKKDKINAEITKLLSDQSGRVKSDDSRERSKLCKCCVTFCNFLILFLFWGLCEREAFRQLYACSSYMEFMQQNNEYN